MIGPNIITTTTAAAAVVNLPRCEGGQGEGCEALAESDYVRQLQQRSAEKYAERRKQQLIRYNYQNFKDYFAFSTWRGFGVGWGLGLTLRGFGVGLGIGGSDPVVIRLCTITQHTQ